MRFALCNEVLRHLPWASACELIAKAGYEGVEIAPFTFAESVFDLGAEERSEIRSIANAYGLEIAGLHWLLVSPEGLHVASENPETRQRTREYLCELARFAHDLGAPVMVFGSPKQRSAEPPIIVEQAETYWLESLSPALDLCCDFGVKILLEPLPAAETNVANRLADAVRLTQIFAHPALKTIFDVKSALSETNAPAELLESYFSEIAHVHLNDSNRRAPGYGGTDFAPILQTLQANGYSGWCSVEPFDYHPDPETLTVETLAYLKGCLR